MICRSQRLHKKTTTLIQRIYCCWFFKDGKILSFFFFRGTMLDNLSVTWKTVKLSKKKCDFHIDNLAFYRLVSQNKQASLFLILLLDVDFSRERSCCRSVSKALGVGGCLDFRHIATQFLATSKALCVNLILYPLFAVLHILRDIWNSLCTPNPR